MLRESNVVIEELDATLILLCVVFEKQSGDI